MAIPRPVTKTKIASAAWGIPITDEVNRMTPLVDANTAASIPTPWTNVTFQNGWGNYVGYTPNQYRKVGDMVQLRGTLAQQGTVNAIAYTLPVGFRPMYVIEMPGVGNNGTGRVVVDVIVDQNGGVKFDPGPMIAIGYSVAFSILP